MQTVVTKPAIEIVVYPEMPPVAALLSKARAYLSEPEHWMKGNFRNQHGQVCALGAFYSACDYAWDYKAPTSFMVEGCNALANACPEPVIAYNDSPSTTHADILALFDRAIAAALAAGK